MTSSKVFVVAQVLKAPVMLLGLLLSPSHLELDYFEQGGKGSLVVGLP